MGGPGSGGKSKKCPVEMVARVTAMYNAGDNQVEIAEALGVTQKVIWNLMRRHNIPTRVASKRDQTGPRNTAWKGDLAGYAALHLRVAQRRGQPQRCERSGTTAPQRYEWANLTGNYVDVNDYERMCVPCHRAFDQQARPRDEAGRWMAATGGDVL